METITIKNKEYSIPTCYQDLGLNTYIKIVDTFNDMVEDETSDNLKKINLLGIIMNEPPMFFYNLKVTEFNKLINMVTFFEVGYEVEEYNSGIIHLGDKSYYVCSDIIENMTMGEQISYQEFIKRTPGRIIDCLAPALALILKENETEVFDSNEYIEKIEYIKNNIQYTDAFNISAFFLSSWKSF